MYGEHDTVTYLIWQAGMHVTRESSSSSAVVAGSLMAVSSVPLYASKHNIYAITSKKKRPGVLLG